MALVKDIETSLAKIFKDLPHLPESSREGLAKVWPWLALIGGIVQLLAAWGLYQLTKFVDTLANITYLYTGSSALSATDKMVIYLGVIILVVDAVLLLMAFPKLQKRERAGWDLLFLGSLLNLVYAVVTLFINARGVSSFVGSLIGSALGFYLLFEVQSKFGGKRSPVKK